MFELEINSITNILQRLHLSELKGLPENSPENSRIDAAPENFRDSLKVESGDDERAGESTNLIHDGGVRKPGSKRERLKRNKQFSTQNFRSVARSDYPQRSWLAVEQMRVEKKNNANNMMCNINIYQIDEHSHSHTSRH